LGILCKSYEGTKFESKSVSSTYIGT